MKRRWQPYDVLRPATRLLHLDIADLNFNVELIIDIVV